MSTCYVNQSKTKVIKIDFGRVSAGTMVERTVKIFNEGCKKQHYQVQRDSKTNPLDYVFTFESDNWISLPGGLVEFKIEYHPTVPFHHSIDYFSIRDCERICYKITVHGTCIGPNVVPSVSRFLMICPKGGRQVKKRLQLTNNSEMTATFLFDIDQTHCPFKLNVTRGIISPNNHIYVTITFLPQQQGLYVLYLPCLIYHQGPIVTELYGYQGPKFSKAEEFVPVIFPDPMPLIRDFKGYMSDGVQFVQGNYPPISMSKNYLDFGKGELHTKFSCKYLPQNVCLVNHTTKDLIVKWDEDPECVFDIKPHSTTVNGQQSGLFEVNFFPNKPDALFSRELLARVFWNAKDISPNSTCNLGSPVPIPLIASIRVIGQSFLIGSIGWIPQYEVPRTVTLPSCLPLLPVYTTFLIKLYGHLPMTFRFIPPRTTNFTAKPMVGIIHREYQVVALQVFPELEGEHIYNESWTIQFNSNSRNEVPIAFKAHAEHPKLIFNENNVIEFAPVHPKCEQVTQVTMRNTTRHCIRFSFFDLPSEIIIKESSGIIQANETLTHDWIFSPKTIRDYTYDIRCYLQALKAGCPVGSDISIALEVSGSAQHGYLMALPEELDFGTVVYGHTKKLSFHAFNFSSIEIHYKLTCIQRGWSIGNTHDIEILPDTETIGPGCKKSINVFITPREPGFYHLIVQYSLRSNSSAKEVLNVVEPRNICILNCICILPSFEIEDLLYFSFREHISKALLWNMLEIDKFNTITSSILPGNYDVINLRFPELVLSQEPLLIKLLIFNSAPTKSAWTLTWIKKCECQQVVRTRGMTFKYKEYRCDHRLACTVTPNKGVLQPRDRDIIAIKVCYILPGKTNLQWRLQLSDNRNVIINANVVSLSDLEDHPSLLANRSLLLEKNYIGDMDAMSQMCWMYNSTDHEVAYSLDISTLHQINTDNLVETFSCKNPHGLVPRQSYFPIIFKFQPRRFQSYQITLPLKLGNTWTNLSIQAETDILSKTIFLPGKVPCLDKFSIPELSIYFSVDHIVVSPMPMHSEVTRMIMIYNESQTEVIGYQWKSYDISNILEIKASPTSGRIQPTKAQSFCITIRSLSQPCKITGTLCCQFLNFSSQRTYEKSIIMYNSLCEELAGQFIITEKGTTELNPWFKPVEKPKPFYKSLTIGCYIYGLMDTDIKASIDEQLKSSPSSEIHIKKHERCTVSDKKLINITAFILEGMIWNILNSSIFKNSLKESIIKKPAVQYGQYIIPSMQRRNLRDRSYNVPPKRLLKLIFHQMILGIVHEEFGLSRQHFNGPKDIRQFCYQKRDPRSHRQNKIHNSNLEDNSSLLPSSVNESESEVPVAGDYHSKQLHTESQVKFNVKDEPSSCESTK